jgi:hypothetical protein
MQASTGGGSHKNPAYQAFLPSSFLELEGFIDAKEYHADAKMHIMRPRLCIAPKDPPNTDCATIMVSTLFRFAATVIDVGVSGS